MLAGVAGGLARYFEIHRAIFRVGFVVLTLLGGAGILIYLAAALVVPDAGKQDWRIPFRWQCADGPAVLAFSYRRASVAAHLATCVSSPKP